MFTMFRSSRKAKTRTVRVQLESLEDRQLMSTLNLTVTNLSDPGGQNGVSLRQAINTANADTVDSQVNVGFTAGLNGTIDLTTALPNLANNINIIGNGQLLTVQRDQNAAGFAVFTVNSGETVSISGLTIAGGNATPYVGNGGGIDSGGALTVNNCVFTDDGADYGGAINNGSGTLTVNNSTFTDNGVYDGGGAIANWSDTATVTNCIFANNSAGGGGAIYNAIGTLTVNDTTFTGNSGSSILNRGSMTVSGSTFFGNTGNDGGGIANQGTATVNGSVFNDNSASNGGGISNLGPDAGGQPTGSNIVTLTVTSSTFTNNTATSGGSGGGVYNDDGTQTVTNSTFTGNSATLGGGVYNSGTATLTSCVMSGDSGGDTYNVGTLTTPGTIQIAPDTNPGGQSAVIVNILTDSDASGSQQTVNEQAYACPFNIIDTNGILHTDEAMCVDLNLNVGTGYASVQPIAIGLANASSATWPGYNINFNSTQGNELAWLEQAFVNAENQPGGTTTDQYAALQVEAWTIIDPNFTFTYAGGGSSQADFMADYNALQTLANSGPEAPGQPSASFAGTQNYGGTGGNPVYTGTLLALDPGANGSQYQNLITPADNTQGVYGALPTINVTGYNVTYDGSPHTATGTATAADGTDLSQYLDVTQTTHTDANWGMAYGDTWTFNDPGVYPVESGIVYDTIAQAHANIYVAPASGLVYNSQWQALGTGTATDIHGVSMSSTDFYFSTQVNAGTYSSTDLNSSGYPVNSWGFNDMSGNYAYESGTLTTTIAQAHATIVATPTPGLVYNGYSQTTATVTATGVVGFYGLNFPLDNDLTVNATHTNAGSYTGDTWSFTDPNGNYAPDHGTVTGNIDQAPLTLWAMYDDKVYDGTTAAGPQEWGGPAPVPMVSWLRGNDTITGLTESFTDPNSGPGTINVDHGFVIHDGNSGNNYAVTCTSTNGWIDSARGAVAITDASGVYNGTPYTATATINGQASLEGVTPVVNYDMILPNGQSESLGTDAPVNVGSYDAWVECASSQNWNNSGYESVSFNITPAPATVSVTAIPGLVYNGTPQETASYSATGLDGLALPSSDFTDTTVHTDAGTITDTWSFQDPSGDYASLSGTVTDTIGQATVMPSITAYYGTYDGNAHGASGTVTGVNGEDLTSGLNMGGTWTNVGDYTPEWSFNGGTNYVSTTGCSDVTITRANATVIVNGYDVTYDGVGHRATGTATGINGVDLTSDLDLLATQHTSANGPTGSVDNFEFSDPTGNYNDVTSQVFDRINRANADVKVTPYDVTYNGQPHTATGTATGVNGTNLASDLTIISAHINAGVYNTDSWSFTDPNYVSQSGTVTDVINKANATGINVLPYNVTYNGAVHTATGVNPVGDLDLTQTEHTNAGTYTDKWFFHGGQNYNDTQGTVTDVINKANATVKVTGYNVNYNAVVHSATGTVTGVNGALPSSDLAITSAHTNAGSYGDSWTFNDPNYVAQSGRFTDVINKANVTVKVAPYNVTYNGAWHAATGTVTGVNGQALAGLNLNSTVHINAGVYRDAWTFTDSTGNYNTTSGLVTDVINKANAHIVVNAYNVVFDGGAHASTGVAIGVYGQALAGLNLGGTVHIGGYYTNTFHDRWTFTDPTGNYNSTSGVVVNTIQANQPLYRALYHPFCPKSPFAGRLFMW